MKSIVGSRGWHHFLIIVLAVVVLFAKAHGSLTVPRGLMAVLIGVFLALNAPPHGDG